MPNKENLLKIVRNNYKIIIVCGDQPHVSRWDDNLLTNEEMRLIEIIFSHIFLLLLKW